MKGKSLNYTVLIEQDEDGIYIAKVPDIPGCYTQGKTVEQVMERTREAIQVCLEAEKLENVTGRCNGKILMGLGRKYNKKVIKK